MKLRIQNVSATVLYALLIVTVAVVAFFFFGGEKPYAGEVPDDSLLREPAYTDLLLYWCYFLVTAAVAVCIVCVAWHFAALLADAPFVALKSLTGVLLLAALLGVSWWAGSTKPLPMPGYEGAGNTPFWLRLIDMFLYTIYMLMAVLLLLIAGNAIRKRFQ